MKIAQILLSSLELENTPPTEQDAYTDVIVLMENGDTYVASFFSFDKIQLLRERARVGGEYLGGKYFWAENLVLIDRCTQENVEQVVEHLLDEGDFWLIFREL